MHRAATTILLPVVCLVWACGPSAEDPGLGWQAVDEPEQSGSTPAGSGRDARTTLGTPFELEAQELLASPESVGGLLFEPAQGPPSDEPVSITSAKIELRSDGRDVFLDSARIELGEAELAGGAHVVRVEWKARDSRGDVLASSPDSLAVAFRMKSNVIITLRQAGEAGERQVERPDVPFGLRLDASSLGDTVMLRVDASTSELRSDLPEGSLRGLSMGALVTGQLTAVHDD